MQRFDQLPETLPVFPLTGAVVMPGGKLPLNIFEPRYLNMLQDAMKSHHLIGMIQPLSDELNPELYKVGCASRITRYEESSDGRLEIHLTGLCRFEIKRELVTTRDYRLVVPDWSRFALDYDESKHPSIEDKSTFVSALNSYFKENNMQGESKVMETMLESGEMEDLCVEDLSNGLFSHLNMTSADKQMLIEIDSLGQRIKAITAILENNDDESYVRH